jgi:hypothetical protein
MRKKLTLLSATAVGVLAGVTCGTSVQAQSADALIDKLMEKGVLTVKEANDLREEADKNFTSAFQVKTGLPDWVSSMKLSGDFRGRWESFSADNPNYVDRNRFRYRLRAGLALSLLDNLEVGMRLGSGDLDNASTITRGVDPISNNQTFQNNGSKKGVFIDLAYGKWAPINKEHFFTSMTVGKMENPFVFSDMVFDKDYTPEGAAWQSAFRFNDNHALKFNTGVFILDEANGHVANPYMLGFQGRYDATWTPKLGSSLGLSYLSIQSPENLSSSAVPDVNVGNSRTTAGALVYEYTPVIVDGAVTYTLASFPLYKGAFPISVGGEYMNNTAISQRNQAYNFGVTLGKSGKKGTWDLSYRWKSLEGDAWYEEVVDSDFGAYYSGKAAGSLANTWRSPGAGIGNGTNVRGHVIKANYSPYDALTISFTTFITELIDKPAATASVPNNNSGELRFMVDATWKF